MALHLLMKLQLFQKILNLDNSCILSYQCKQYILCRIFEYHKSLVVHVHKLEKLHFNDKKIKALKVRARVISNQSWENEEEKSCMI